MDSPNAADAAAYALPRLRLPPHVEAYLADVVRACAVQGSPVASVVLFGSTAAGGYAAAVSDVDLLLVLRHGATAEVRRQVRDTVSALEVRHGLAKTRSQRRGALEAFAERITANQRAFFVCSREDMLSGSPARILDISPIQARFVDRIAIPSILGSAVVVWGEDVLARVPLPPIRRLDVAKAFFGLFNQVLFCVAVYPVLAAASRYAMDALKRSVHSCYFCYHGRNAVLADEIAFFQQRHGPSRTLSQLMLLRCEYRRSFRFVLACLPAVARLHLRTALGNRFPREVSATPGRRWDVTRTSPT